MADEEAQAKIREELQKSGFSIAFSWVKIDGQVVVGWNPEKYAELI